MGSSSGGDDEEDMASLLAGLNGGKRERIGNSLFWFCCDITRT